MNRSNFEHAGYALLMQVGLWMVACTWMETHEQKFINRKTRQKHGASKHYIRIITIKRPANLDALI